MTAAPDIEAIRDALRKVADPEIGANIVDIGLVYRIAYENGKLWVDMTMTSPACPMGGMIVDDAYAELARILPKEVEMEIQVVWEPPWKPSMMSEQCRERLGWSDSDAD
ncbi:MAG TPA: metal-sulfur cluster assembly factor [Azonexus sp.]|uniref:Metal-sulfur cluster assembly factor n=1 Tax=Dechloromonas hankyongensis TaxID=2908002 RepID=A0ABS9JXC8_9RHOO|nr:metal-sulfur cluster assembly factor [Dechloromonas hankyongensis]MCG2575554.1 metal-sulfur cluster assembly factor [Dechloromonas hankyongensis]HLO62372.1 metal-sulfur cluster assembly factor [Azonexus sp.]